MLDFPLPQRGSIWAEDSSLFQEEGQPQDSLCCSLAPRWWSNSLSEVAVSLTTTLSGTCICYSLSSETREKMICQAQLILSHAKAAFIPPLMLLTKGGSSIAEDSGLQVCAAPGASPVACCYVSGIYQHHPQHHYTLLLVSLPWECVNLFLRLPKSLSSCGNSGQSAAVSLH